MSVVTIFSGSHCGAEPLVEALLQKTGFRRISDEEVVAAAAGISGLSESRVAGAFSSKTSIFNKFTHEKERAVAHLKRALAEVLDDGDLLITGYSGLLVPRRIGHVLRVCIIADLKSRIEEAGRAGLSEKEAVSAIQRDDQERAAWVQRLYGKSDPWDDSLFDIVLPTDKTQSGEGAELIVENLAKRVVQPTAASKRAVEDFCIAARVETVLAGEGHAVEVNVRGGKVVLTINKHVLMLARLEEELRALAEPVEGVTGVETRVGKDFHRADVYRRYDFRVPSKVLLVDDEREFVQTLSERLLMRDVGSAVAYDGESALDIVREDEPDVIILDLKMPGIDGIEVLRRVKETNPAVEVIILTGHGSEADCKTCMDLGAFAYLQKPVDIEVLSETLRQANEKIREKTSGEA